MTAIAVTTQMVGPYRVTDMGNIVAVVKVTKRGAQRFIGQFSSLDEALAYIGVQA